MTGPPRGRLIALEGVDGCGKSTQAELLADRLGALLTHEPGATSLGRALRTLVLEPSGTGPVPRAEALMMAADRAQHVDEVIEPALREGRWVVTDRFSGSTLAYQGWGRGLASEPLRAVVAWAAAGCEPDLNVLVDVPLEVARRRLSTSRPDRLESLDEGFHQRVRHGFLALARSEAERWVVVDGTPDPSEVAARIFEEVERRLIGASGKGPTS